MSIRPKWIRDIASIIFSFYYIIYAQEADEKVLRNRLDFALRLINCVPQPSFASFARFRRWKCSVRHGKKPPTPTSVYLFRIYTHGSSPSSCADPACYAPPKHQCETQDPPPSTKVVFIRSPNNCVLVLCTPGERTMQSHRINPRVPRRRVRRDVARTSRRATPHVGCFNGAAGVGD